MTRTMHVPAPGILREADAADAATFSGSLAARLRRLAPGRRVSQKQLLIMTGQLATMLASGCDLCAGLQAMLRQETHPRMREILTDLHNSVAGGHAFSQALARHPDVFSRLYVTMVRAGEQAGLLKPMLQSLQTMIRNQLRITSSVRGALMYPAILTVVAFGAIAVMTLFVLPRFAKIFQQSHAVLPLPTQILLGVTTFASQHILLILLVVATLIAGIVWLFTLPWMRRHTHRWALRLPLIGPTLRASAVVRSLQALGMLTRSGLPLAEALLLTRDLMHNVYYWQFLDELRAHIAEGKTLAADFERTTLFPAMAAQMIGVGEQTGTLAQVCLEVAAFHEEEMQERIKILTTALEPLIICVLGGFVGFIALSVILPMFRLSGVVSGK